MPRPPRVHEPGYYRGIIEAFPPHAPAPDFGLVAKAERLRVRIGSEAARDRFFIDLKSKRKKS